MRVSAGGGAWIGMLPFSVYVLVFLGLPIYEVIRGALSTTSGAFTFENFKTIFSGSQYWIPLENSVILSAWTAVVGAIFGTWLAAAVVASPAGSMLRRMVSSGSGVLAYFAGVPLAFAFIAALGRAPGGVVTTLLKHIGFDLYAHGFSITSLLGVGLAYTYFQVPMMVILITPALEGLRPQWQEAAESLGASRLEYLRHIAIPVMAPAFIGSLLILFGNAFSAYATALALVGASIPLIPAAINEAINGNVLVNQAGIAQALGVEMILIAAIVLTFYWLVQRRARRWLQ
ncbi:ABC transporter permease subunit [Conexibacter sp. S30A1]|jgi:putative spermidine/putrescine transport system permease protein|uniref:ABC transporter permease n=1 Tax=Conexibacter sp. S30A1 TaxID=2937800 RepID=UPI00200D1DA9|nr:ABC transporter permease subunit [Conexibacter sp. S30A1]